MRVIVIVGGTAVEAHVPDTLLGYASSKNDRAQDVATEKVRGLFTAAYLAERDRRVSGPEVMSGYRKMIADTISTDVAKLLYYDRKEDEDLPCNAIEEAIAAGDVTVADMVAWFTRELLEGLGT